jgi:hypothetical protein
MDAQLIRCRADCGLTPVALFDVKEALAQQVGAARTVEVVQRSALPGKVMAQYRVGEVRRVDTLWPIPLRGNACTAASDWLNVRRLLALWPLLDLEAYLLSLL